MPSKSRRFSISNVFEKSIPKEIHNDIEYIVDGTRYDGKERSITLCKILYKKPDKIQVSDYTVGSKSHTHLRNCDQTLGKSVKIGDVHTHPVSDDSPNITPSPHDFAGNIVDSKISGVRQISCITNHKSKMIHCFRPNKNISLDKLVNYNNAIHRTDQQSYLDPFLRENIPHDFEHRWYDRNSYKYLRNPNIDDLVHDALGEHLRPVREGKYFSEWEKGEFCELIADFNVGNDNPKYNEAVADKCREKIRRFTLLGVNVKLPFL